MANWVKVETRFTSHPKVLDIGPLGEALWLRGLCYAGEQLTDGFIPSTFIKRMGDMKAVAVAEKLVNAGLWEETDGGYLIHDFLEWQRSRDQVETVSSKRVEAGRLGGKQKASNLLAKSQQNDSKTPSKSLAHLKETDTETEKKQKEYAPVVPTGSTSEPTEKPRTERQKASDALYERKMAIVAAYFRGLGIEEGTLPWNQRKGQALACLTSVILASPECVPEIIEPLTRYTRSAFQWRNGKKTPQLSEVLAAFAEWDADGRPDGVAKTIRPPVSIASRPQLPPVMQPGHVPKDGGLAEWRNAGNSGGT